MENNNFEFEKEKEERYSQIEKEKLLFTRIEDLDMSPKLYNFLRLAKIKTLKEVIEKLNELHLCRNFSRKIMNEINELLEIMNFSPDDLDKQKDSN